MESTVACENIWDVTSARMIDNWEEDWLEDVRCDWHLSLYNVKRNNATMIGINLPQALQQMDQSQHSILSRDQLSANQRQALLAQTVISHGITNVGSIRGLRRQVCQLLKGDLSPSAICIIKEVWGFDLNAFPCAVDHYSSTSPQHMTEYIAV